MILGPTPIYKLAVNRLRQTLRLLGTAVFGSEGSSLDNRGRLQEDVLSFNLVKIEGLSQDLPPTSLIARDRI